MTFGDLIEFCQAEAMANKLSPDEAYLWRKLCREYSKLFHTPLHEVLKLDAVDVVLNVYEERTDSIKLDDQLEDWLDLIYGMIDPEYDSRKSAELEADIMRYEAEEKKRIAEGKPIPVGYGYKRSRIKEAIQNVQTLPNSGGIDLSHLEEDENER